MRLIFTIIPCILTVINAYSQSCSNCVSFIGDAAHEYKQLVLDTKYPTFSDTTQTEIPAAAWTCNSLGFPTCNNRGLFKFNLATIPSNAIITTAKLFLYANTENLNGQTGSPMFGTSNTSLLQKVETNWTVSNTGWDNQPVTTTTNEKVLLQSSSTIQNYIVDVTDFARFWINKPDSNYGMLLKLQNEQYYNSMIFYSGKTINDSLKPRLEICYYLPSLNQLVLRGDTTGNIFKQLLLDTKGPLVSDTTQPEIAASAWTCNSLGFPTCNNRSLFKFNTSQIPFNSIINSARLVLSAKTNNINGQPGNPMFGSANTSLLQKVTENWLMPTTGWNNQPSTTDINQKILPQSISNVENYTIDVTDFVQHWVNKPDSNYGMLLKLENEVYYNSMIFHSGRAPNDSLKPRLEICYNTDGLLPLSISSFTVTKSLQSNLLRWTIYNAQDLSKIVVERSLNGINYNTITIIRASENSNESSYNFEDFDIKNINKVYYRIRFINKDGKVFYSKVLFISNTNITTFKVYPNPAKNSLQLSVKAPHETITKIKIENIMAQAVHEQYESLTKGLNFISLSDIHKLPQGIYFISMMIDNEILKQKIIIQR